MTFTVQGCGKVGSTVAKELVRYGAKCVQTCDIYPELAVIEGCNTIKDWTTTPCDFLVPCANSLAITENVAANFPRYLQFCCGATNSLFKMMKRGPFLTIEMLFTYQRVFLVPVPSWQIL